MHRTWDTIPLHNLYKGVSKIATFVECRVFRGGPTKKWRNVLGGFLHKSRRQQSFVQFLKKIRRCAFRFWSYSNSNIGDRNVCAQIYCENFKVRTVDRIMEKILCHKTDLKN